MYSPYIQIVHVNSNHWITIEGVCGDLVRVYDSKYRSLANRTKKIISVLTKPSGNFIDAVMEHTQMQRGYSDCGVYAIAFAVDLCFGQHPANLR